ncbi:DNA excision repair protein ERCC-8 [Mactra antiquata]
MLRFLNSRELGVNDPLVFYRAESTRRVLNLGLSEEKSVEKQFTGNVNTLDVDLIEKRYLLAGGADGYIIIYDTFNTSGSVKYTCPSVGTIALNNRHRHKFHVDTVLWYPLDTGMFTSSGTDCLLKVWDTNRLKPADEYQFSGIVYNHHMSPIATRHCLIAVACQSSSVKLVDLKSGSATHGLKGHSKGVYSVKWSPYNEFTLASAGADCKILLWDIRNAKGSLLEFDQYNGKPPENTAGSDCTAHSRPVTGLQFSSDGLWLVSCGIDKMIRVWCTSTGRKTNVDIPLAYPSKKTAQFAVSQGCSNNLIFMPNGKSVDVFDMTTGKLQYALNGHFKQAICCYYHPDYHELYSGGSDRNILVWTSQTHNNHINYIVKKTVKRQKLDTQTLPNTTTSNVEQTVSSATADNWSSDEET